MAEHRRVVREAFAAHGGYEVDYEGDAFFYAFASAQAAVDGGRRRRCAGWSRGRSGSGSGCTPASRGSIRPSTSGMDVHLAARVMSAGHGGQVLLSQATRELVEPSGTTSGEHRLKDIAEPVWLYQLGEGEFPPLKTI